MESFLRRKLAQAGSNRSTLQKPISSYQSIKLPDLCPSFYSIADEPFPQVSGFLDDTFGQSFLSNEAGTVLNSLACTSSENETKNKDDSVLNRSLGAPCQLADGSMSTRSLQHEKDSATADGHGNDPAISTTSLEKSDFLSAELKNSSFNVTQDLKERSDAGGNATADLHNIREKNRTFESQESKERPDANSTVDIDVPNIKTESGNTTVDLVQSHDLKESLDNGVNATVDIPYLDGTHSKASSSVDNGAALNTTTEKLNEKLEGTIDLQPQEKSNGILNLTEGDKIRKTEEANLKVRVTVDDVERMASAPHQPSGEIEQSSSNLLKPAETGFTKHNTTTDLTPPEVPVLKDTTVEIKPSSTELADLANGASNSVEITKPVSNSRETEVEISTSAFVCSVDAPNDALELKAEELHKTTERPELAEVESIPSSDISRYSIFCLDDTLDLKTSFMVTSTPIVFCKESRFEILKDAMPTPMRKRLSVINSIEAQSNDELVCVSNHSGSGSAVQATESSGQKVSVNCTSSHGTSEPANENKPPTKLPIKRQLPQFSSKLSYPKSSLPPRPQSSMSSSVVVKPKTVQGPQPPHPPNTSPTTLLGKRNAVQINKGKNIAPVKNTASASNVKTSMVSSVTGYNFTAVAKPSSSGGIPQMKRSGLKPPTRKRMTLKTPQTTQSSIETTQACNKPPTGLPGLRTRNSLPSSVGLNNDGLPSAKRKRIAHTALSTVEGDAMHPAEEAHESGCVDCLRHQEKLERILQELMGLRSDCTNWGPLHEKLEKHVREMKRI